MFLEDEENTYVPIAERLRRLQQSPEQIEPVSDEPEFLDIEPPVEISPEMQKPYVSIAERLGREPEGLQSDYGPLEERGPTFGSLVERSVVTAAEAFNSPFKLVGRSIWNIGQRLGDPDSDAEIPEFLVDQRTRLAPAETTAEKAVDVFAETAGATLGMLMPTNAAAQLYARSAGMSRVSTKIADEAFAAAAPYERGIPHKTLFDKLVNKQETALIARQKARIEAVEASGKKPGLVTRTAQQARDLPTGLARAGQAISQAPQAIARSYIDEPGKNFIIEATAAIGAGAGAGLMEAAFPGSFTARSVGTIVGGFSPVALAVRGGANGTDALKNVVRSFSGESRRKLKLAKILTEGAKAHFKSQGIEPTPEVIKAWREKTYNLLAQQDMKDFDLTPGMITGDPVLLGFESAVANSNVQYKGYREQTLKNAFNTLDTFLAGLFRSGNPENIRLAAEFRYAADKDRLEKVLQEAQRHYAELIAAKLDFSPEGKTEASKRAREIVFDVWDRATNAEKKAYALFSGRQNPFDGEANPFASTLAAKAKAESEVTKTRPLPFKRDLDEMVAAVNYNKKLEKIKKNPKINEQEKQQRIKKLKAKTPKGIKNYTVKKMTILRRDLLDEARDLRNKGQLNRARIHSDLARGIFNDLEEIPALQVDSSYQRAAAFTKAKEDAFSDNFVSRVIATDDRGRPRVNPEVVLQEAFGSIGSRSPERRLRLQQLEQAADFDPSQTARMVDDEVETFGFEALGLGPQVIKEEEAFLRASLASLVDADGNISRTRLNNFLSDPENQQILNRPEMSDLRRDLQSIETAEARVRAAQKTNELDRIAVENTAFANMAGGVNPEKAIRTIMNSNSSEISSKIKGLADEARVYDTKAGEENAAINGLLRGVIDYAFSKANINLTESGQRIGNVSFIRLLQVLEDPVRAGSPSIEKLIKTNRLMTEAEWESYTDFIKMGADLEAQMNSPEIVESLDGSINAGTDLAIRILGANVGSRIGQFIPGRAGSPGLVEASAGVRLTRSVVEKMPLQKLKEMQVRAAKNREFTQEVLMLDYTPTNRASINARINLFLIESGILSIEDIREIYGERGVPQQEVESAPFTRFGQ